MRKPKRLKYQRGAIKLGWRGSTAVADYRDASGRRRRQNLGELSDEQARAALDRFADAHCAVLNKAARHTVGDLWRMWLDDRAKDGLRNDIYKANWVALAPFFATRSPDFITADDCRTYARQRFEAGRAPATVATELTRLRSCLQWAAKEHLLLRMPRIWVPSRGEPRQTVITMAEAARLAEGAHDYHVRLFILLAIATGARHGAILDLTWDRVDFERGVIQYDTGAKRNPMSRSWRKGRATVPLGDRLRQELMSAKMAAQTPHVIEHGGRRLKSIREGFAAAVERAGLPANVTPHTLRHSVATWLKECGIDLERRAQLLGHTDTRTTDVVYSHADAAILADAVRLIEQGTQT